MTLQQEATNMINSMPDDTVQLIIEMMKKMSSPVTLNNYSNKNNRFGAGIGVLNDPAGFDDMNKDVLDYFEEAGCL